MTQPGLMVAIGQVKRNKKSEFNMSSLNILFCIHLKQKSPAKAGPWRLA
jgi:hypothetical protein